MTELATRGFNYAYDLRDPGSSGPVVREFPIATGQTAGRKGDLVVLSSGRVTLAAANASDVLGVLMETALGTVQDDLIKVAVLMPGQVWACKVDGAAIAATAVGTRTVNIVNAYTVDTTPLTSGTLVLVAVDGTTAYVAGTDFALA